VASVVKRVRKGGAHYQVKWRLGGARDGTWQSETFVGRLVVGRFKADVEAYDHAWPDGWVKGHGYIRAGEDSPPAGVHPLAAYGLAYIRRLTSAGPDTQSTYVQQLDSLVGWLREIKHVEPTVQNLTTNDDRDWIVARRRGGASPKTIANYHGLLYAIMREAVREGLRPNNPCDGVKLPARDDDIDDDEDKVFLTEEEFTQLHSCVGPDVRDFVLVDAGTGLRWGEITALMVKDLDLDSAVPTLTVRRAWKRNGRGQFAVEAYGKTYLGKPKTKLSRRRITLSPTVVGALRRSIAGKSPDDFVFTAPGGGALNRHNFYNRRWQPALRAARKLGLTKSPRFHDLRHSHAAWLISAGVPLPVVQRRLGHQSIQITVDVYGGLLFQTHEIADEAIERALAGQRIHVGIESSDAVRLSAGEVVDDESSDAA
jgi:integrase